MMTALSDMPGWRNSLLRSVVFPLPRNPVMSETGSRSADLSRSNRLMRAPRNRSSAHPLDADLNISNSIRVRLQRRPAVASGGGNAMTKNTTDARDEAPSADRRQFLKTASALGAAGAVAGAAHG